jgi:putative NADH-flavin reductase
VQIAIAGAAGRTGLQVTDHALDRGHRVKALARRPESILRQSDRLATVAIDVLDRDALADALAGCDAVISTLGVGTSRAPTQLYSQGIANVLHAMHVHTVRRLAVVSTAPVGPRDQQPFLERRIAMPILDRLFRSTYDDMRRMEAVLGQSDVDWVCLRPPRLVAKNAVGAYRLDADRPLAKARSLTTQTSPSHSWTCWTERTYSAGPPTSPIDAAGWPSGRTSRRRWVRAGRRLRIRTCSARSSSATTTVSVSAAWARTVPHGSTIMLRP